MLLLVVRAAADWSSAWYVLKFDVPPGVTTDAPTLFESKTMTCEVVPSGTAYGVLYAPPTRMPLGWATASFAARLHDCASLYAFGSRNRYQPCPARVHCSWLPRVTIQGAAARSFAAGWKKSA